MTHRLRLSLELMPDETASSFASRLALKNNVQSLRSFCADLGINYENLRLGKPEALQRLAILSGADFESLQAQTITYEGPKLCRIGKEKFRGLFLKKSLYRFCPLCLSEETEKMGRFGSYSRLQWEAEIFTSCHKHLCKLVEVESKGEVDFARDIGNRSVSYGNKQTRNVCETDLALETYLLDRIRGLKHNTWLDQNSLSAVKALCENLGALLTIGPTYTPKTMSDNDWLNAGSVGFRELFQKPDQLTKALAQFKSDQAFCLNTRRSDLGAFSVWLSNKKGAPDLDFLLGLMRDFSERHYPLPKGSPVYGKKTRRRYLHTILSASKEENIERAVLERLLVDQGFAKRLERRQSVQQTRPISVSDAKRFKVEALNWLRFGEACKCIGVTKAVLCKVIKHSGVRTLEGGKEVNRLYWEDDLKRFNQRLWEHVLHVDTIEEGFLNFKDVVEKYHLSTLDIYDHVVTAKIQNVMTLNKRPRIRELLFSKTELDQLLDYSDDEGVTLNQAQKTLKVNSNSVAYLLKLGQLSLTRNKVDFPPLNRKSISKKSLMKFDEKYVSIAKAAEEFDVHSMSLTRDLQLRGIPYIFDRKYSSKIVRRDDLV